MKSVYPLLLLVCLLGPTGGAAEGPREAPVFKLYLEHAGIYRVSFEELAAAGLEGEWPSEVIGLRRDGRREALYVADGGDGRFGPSDHLELLGRERRGEHTYLDEYSRHNCYVLSFDDQDPARFGMLAVGRPALPSSTLPQAYFHLERDILRLRFTPRDQLEQEVWYWAKLTHLDKQAFAQVLDLSDLEPASDGSLRIRLGLRAWSEPRLAKGTEIAEHRMEIGLNGLPLGAVEWNGNEPYRHEVEVPAASLKPGESTLALQVSKRKVKESDRDLLVDVVMLNWIELEYPQRSLLAGGQRRLRAQAGGERLPIRVDPPQGEPLVLVNGAGQRAIVQAGSAGSVSVTLADADDELFASAPSNLRQVDRLVPDRPSRLLANDQQADYIVIAEHTLMETISPLVELHRGRGLTVTVVDVEDIFDELNFGVVHPRAIRDFISHAYHNWLRPAPRFVLLVGDASWDFKNDIADDTHYADWTYRPGERVNFVKNASTPYAEEANLNRRNLVPTWNYPTYQGYAASDTWFVCVDGDDEKPDLAIGRLPVASAEELAGVVAKTLAFIAEPEVGPWRHNLLLITNEDVGFQRSSDSVARRCLERGLIPHRIYPQASEIANEQHTRRIVDELDQGVGIVHFLGHGGRYIWRTGPPDLKKNHDLFTLEHLDQLEATRRLPVVLSLTCYSAPFDHPSADSIGEKFLRIPERGAIGVLAASWRNSPSPAMGQILIDELTTPGTTIGEAVLRAKQKLTSPVLVQTYNLLGDPAAPAEAPQHPLLLELRREGDTLVVSGSSELDSFSGQAVVELVDAKLEVVLEKTFAVDGPRLAFALAVPAGGGEELLGAAVYIWSSEQRLDAAGFAPLAASGDEKVNTAAEQATPNRG